jgi:hypothetical protein
VGESDSGERKMGQGGHMKLRDHLEDLVVDGKVKLKCTFKMYV